MYNPSVGNNQGAKQQSKLVAFVWSEEGDS